ncbi:TetR/AcrR family transcriptional regulator [Brachybacterium sp. EF45031]|uniref:TetR/AcrR family transcriptional regulator n=1 Tax=Brachybacterium sillae TaxID=2810536 RepID=UPI00217CFB8E|nr:TetR/AcrR family transcriptional regulator [Brachybacterium sillae]MCS6711491.1 TetR/AcrR family transcriptional regulator [Brachybacterium sillae]
MAPTVHGSGAGPVPVATSISDRAGETTAEAEASAPASMDPLSRAIVTLDAVAGDEAPRDHSGSRGRRAEILEAASALFTETGYHGTSLRDISRRVGISHPGMLHHFPSKEILLGSVIEVLEEHAQTVIDDADRLTQSPQALHALFDGALAPTDPRIRLLATLAGEAVSPDYPARFRVARLRRVHEHILERVFAAYEGRDLLREGIDPAFASRTMVSLLLSLAVRESTIRSVQPGAAGAAGPDLHRALDIILAGQGRA